ncbi:MAG: ABC transporter ATP-binding protein [Candidatus Woesearchaeota archaeon]
MIQIKHISKKYYIPHIQRTTLFEKIVGFIKEKNSLEEFYVLKDISFEIEKGEIFGIIGNNGCGKTTLLKIIGGIISPNSGTVHTKQRIVSFLDLGIGFHPELTARENIYLYGTIMGITQKKLNKEFEEILHFAGVERFADMKLKQFSSGMAMRLAFATMIRTEFDTIILDEVFAVGDLEFKKKCVNELMKFKKQGKTIIITSHGMDAIIDLCDRAMLLEDGKIKAIGKPEEVVQAYIVNDTK